MFSFGKSRVPNKQVSNFQFTVFVMKMKKFGHRTRDFFKGTYFENFIEFGNEFSFSDLL